MEPILYKIGASKQIIDPAKTYLNIVSLGGVFAHITQCYFNVIRAEGRSGKAMLRETLGNIINIILNPIMILGLSWGIAGVAIAIVIGNMYGAGCHILLYL